ncbi:DUF3566 domain-containing protein [uncultured Rothia sp.]|uniref:DUF3566 domain-containing protein n=1 Tax=uncultured Rothia sp. TaxID=316088 RepID=UPI0025FB7B8E|nr:DUF3566 domain-containing protein [uncultured Rothia sp.]
MSSTPASSSPASAQRSASAGASKSSGAAKAGARRPAQSRSGQARPGGTAKRPVNAKRPTGSRRQLVRPAPRSKIRRARLVVQKVDTWSVAKLIFLLSIALGIVTVVASVILWLFLQASGAFTGVNQLISSLGTGSTTVDISQMISLGQVALVTTIFAVVNTVVFTLLGMIGAILYNLAAKLVGGVTLTLSDES